MDDIASLKNRFDKDDMYGKIASMADQILEGIGIANDADLGDLESLTFHSAVIAGMGGSAIAGDIAKDFLAGEFPIPVLVQRHYKMPSFVNKRSLVICSSYSGNTEETLSAYEDAKSRGARILAITSGGKLANRARKDHFGTIIIPGGLPPRAALGYSFSTSLIILFRLGLCPPPFEALNDTAKMLKSALPKYGIEAGDSNPALKLAREMLGTIPVIYGGQDSLGSIATRFKCQICENAEVLAFNNVVPEFNHNELVGWGKPEELSSKLLAIFIRDGEDHPRIKARMNIVSDYLMEKGCKAIEINSEPVDLLSRMFLLIQLTDFASYFLALLNGTDPTPVKAIDSLKNKLSEIK